MKNKVLTVLLLCVLLPAASFAASPSDVRLVEAAKNQDKASVAALLKQRVDVNAPQGDGATALHWAAHWDDLDMAALLLRAGANVNAVNDLGVTALYLACSNGDGAMTEKLLVAGANPNTAAVTGVTPLMTASESGSVEAVQALLKRGANLNAKENARGQTALMWAVSEQHPEVVRVLLEHGADVHSRSLSAGTLMYISREGNESRDGVGLSKTIETGGSTPLMFAARVGDIESARILLGAGASPNETDANGNSVLVVAAHSGQATFAAFLLDNSADPNAAGAGYAALHAAVLRGELDLVKALLAHGADPNIRVANGTPVRREGPDYNLTIAEIGATGFWLAAKYGSIDMMSALAAAGADPQLATRNGITPLMAALTATARTGGNSAAPRLDETRILATAKVVLDLGGDVNAADPAGDTALHLAASRGYNKVVQLLVDRGAMVDAKNKRGQTPLALAQGRFKSTVDLLRKSGAAELAANKSEKAAPKLPAESDVQ